MHPGSPFALSTAFFDDSTGFRTRLYWAQLIAIAIVTPLSFVLNKLSDLLPRVRGTHVAASGVAGGHACLPRPGPRNPAAARR